MKTGSQLVLAPELERLAVIDGHHLMSISGSAIRQTRFR